MPRVGIVSVAQSPLSPGDPTLSIEGLVFDVARRAADGSGLERSAIDLTISGSSDMLEGRSFSFVMALEAMGAWPAVHESHLEMDGAWAAYYAWLKLQSGAADSALVVAWGKGSEGSLSHVLNTQLDPFCLAPLGLDHVASAALQADAWMERTGATPESLDAVVARARQSAAKNPALRNPLAAQADGPLATPLSKRHVAPVTDGACALVMATEKVARRVCDRPAWIVGADHRSESGALGHRDLSRLPSATDAAFRACSLAGWEREVAPDVAELSASFAHQEPMLVEALGLPSTTIVNPSGGALAADPIMATGLIRLGECALQLMRRAGGHQVERPRRALAHAASGHALQQNLVWLLEAEVW